jgi:hypothetical protein
VAPTARRTGQRPSDDDDREASLVVTSKPRANRRYGWLLVTCHDGAVGTLSVVRLAAGPSVKVTGLGTIRAFAVGLIRAHRPDVRLSNYE